MKKFFSLLFILCSGVQSVYAERARTNSGKLPDLLDFDFKNHTGDLQRVIDANNLKHEIENLKDVENSDLEEKAKLLPKLQELVNAFFSFIDRYKGNFDDIVPYKFNIEQALNNVKNLPNKIIISITRDLSESKDNVEILLDPELLEKYERAAEKIKKPKDYFTQKISQLAEKFLEHTVLGDSHSASEAYVQMFDLSNQADKILETSDLSNQADKILETSDLSNQA